MESSTAELGMAGPPRGLEGLTKARCEAVSLVLGIPLLVVGTQGGDGLVDRSQVTGRVLLKGTPVSLPPKVIYTLSVIPTEISTGVDGLSNTFGKAQELGQVQSFEKRNCLSALNCNPIPWLPNQCTVSEEL